MIRRLPALALTASLATLPAALHAQGADPSWEGAWGGLVLGYGTGESEQVNALGPTTGDYGIEGGLAGITFGHDWQQGALVFGLMGEALSGAVTGNTFDTCVDNCFTDIDWTASLRARFGYDAGRVLPYLTAGVALHQITTGVSEANSIAAPLSQTDINATAIVGAGVEARVADGWTLRLEYLLSDLGDTTYHIPDQDSAGFVDGTAQSLTLAALYRFGEMQGAEGGDTGGTWAGPYAGLVLGQQDATSRQDNSFPATTGDYDLDGTTRGLFAGHNWQSGNLVFGAEVEYGLSDLAGESTVICPPGCFTEVTHYAILRAQAGYDMGRWMPYAVLGTRIAESEVGTSDGLLGARDVNAGAVAGLGLSFALSDAVFLRAEALHGDLGDTVYFVPSQGEIGTVPVEDVTDLRLGLGWSF